MSKKSPEEQKADLKKAAEAWNKKSQTAKKAASKGFKVVKNPKK